MPDQAGFAHVHALDVRRLAWFVTKGILPRPPGAASSKRVLDGALGTDAPARRTRLGSRARLLVENLPMGSHFIEGGARRGLSVARPWGVGRGEPILPRKHRRAAPRVLTVPKELTKGGLWGGSAPPNGSRLSCGALKKDSFHNLRAPPASSAC